jgi:menaquinone-dependent protoporphyrinogen oxidase
MAVTAFARHPRYSCVAVEGEAMEPLVLVAYATRYGSTEQTAREVATILTQDGLQVEVRSVDDLSAWKPYSAVVLAAALYMGRLHREARRFLAGRREHLATIPVALLVPGPVTAESKDWTGAQQQLQKELARMPWLHPVAQRIIGGKWDPTRLQFPFRWILKKLPGGDARDWNSIRAVAHEIAGKFQGVSTQA